MRSTRQLSITLPNGMADAVRARVASGRYASESEVIRHGLRALEDQERAIGDWLAGPIKREYVAWEEGTLETVGLEEFGDELARDRASTR